MNKSIIKTLVIVSFLILLPSEVFAINLGSLAKNKLSDIIVGETAQFKVLFWNIENEPYRLKLSAKEFPKDWEVIIDPDEFVLNRTTGEEYISLPYLSENIQAKVVNIFIKPDLNSVSGKYSVIIKADVLLTSQNGINGMSIIPERLFKFEINLNGFENANDEKEHKIEYLENKLIPEVERLEIKSFENENNSKEYFYSFVVLLIVLISIIIYKK